MRYAMTAAIAATSAFGTTGLQAETLNYYYVSGPALIANQERVEDRPLVNTGRLVVDTSGLAPGETLAGRTVGLTPSREESEGHEGIGISFDFSLGLGSEGVAYRLTFDENENISRWSFSSDWNHTFPEMGLFSVTNAGSIYQNIYSEWPPFENVTAERVLSDRVIPRERLPMPRCSAAAGRVSTEAAARTAGPPPPGA